MHENTGSQRDAASTIFNLPNYRVIDAVDLPDGGRRVVIASTVPPGCPSCGVLATKVHSRRSQQVRDVPVAGAAVVVWAKRRWFCLEPACARGTFAEATEQIPRYARSTTRLRDQVVSAVITSGRAASEVARAHGVSWWLVQAALSAAAVVLPDVDDVRVRRLGVDEHRYRSVRWFRTDQGAWRRFEPWMTTLVDLGTGQVLGIVDGRDSRAVGDWLAQRSEAWRERIEIVAIDPSAAFRKALRTYLPRAAGLGRQVPPRQARKRHGHHRQAAPGPRPSRPSRSQGGSGLGAPNAATTRRRHPDPEGLGAARGRVPHR